MRTVQVKQASGAIRILALTDEDGAEVARNLAMLDAVRPLGCVDVFRDGRKEWAATGPLYRDIPADVRSVLDYESAQ